MLDGTVPIKSSAGIVRVELSRESTLPCGLQKTADRLTRNSSGRKQKLGSVKRPYIRHDLPSDGGAPELTRLAFGGIV